MKEMGKNDNQTFFQKISGLRERLAGPGADPEILKSDPLSLFFFALEGLQEMVVITDLDHRIVYVNSASRQVLGYSPAEMIGRPARDFWGDIPGNPDNLAELIRQESSESGWRGEIFNRRRDGKLITVDLKMTPIRNNDGQLAGYLGAAEDITERKRMEDELITARKLESLGLLADGIAHDFNNILTAIMGNISFARLDIENKSEAGEALADAETACLQAQGLTRRLLTFSRIGETKKEPFFPGPLIRDSVKLALHGSNVDCHFELDDNLPAVEGDRDQIGQVISNLAINAVQAMAQGGEMTIRAAAVRQKKDNDPSLAAGGYLKIEVEDQGTGIPTKYLSRIFDPYFTTKQKGSGLGLATVHSIVQKHGGKISVQSTPGRGTVFTVYLPASEKTPSAEPEKKKNRQRKRPAPPDG